MSELKIPRYDELPEKRFDSHYLNANPMIVDRVTFEIVEIITRHLQQVSRGDFEPDGFFTIIYHFNEQANVGRGYVWVDIFNNFYEVIKRLRDKFNPFGYNIAQMNLTSDPHSKIILLLKRL